MSVNKRILVVDDSATMLMSLKGSLEMSGFKVDTAIDGKAALDKIKAGLKPDLIISDLNMPRMDGIELVRETRKVLKFTPILMLSTESQKAKREQAKAQGATGWLMKPIHGSDLLKVVWQVVPNS
ncbi:response regulator receiver protein [Sphaerotilus natans subsp. natans DSM 6575]|uniref:Response regulator receiver protein n=1 Tax=Sphaerotilus natans subsp. natans DSM 6575 TaxID=1286631 RepID=A0A059KHD7_9BURK|nr:response regulator [Sphaerotilus natans]KDB50887.1 response regulator receiver protein [Sphaerotilus natans subsp. natans DSM 6575]SIR42220.1 two-component system, chemotaxis family, response regulator CheY [Sphaerotilus natans]